MKVIIAIALLVFIIGGFVYLQIKNRNTRNEKPHYGRLCIGRP